MGFWPWKLLFFQPVLLEARQGSHTRVHRMGLTAALFVVQVHTAGRTQPPATALADSLHGQRQKHLLAQNIRQKKALALVEANIRLVFLKTFLLRLCALRQRSVKKVKGTV